jgi:hypothetical protein
MGLKELDAKTNRLAVNRDRKVALALISILLN